MSEQHPEVKFESVIETSLLSSDFISIDKSQYSSELKNPLTGQNVEDAIRQYKNDRDPQETIFEFKKRTSIKYQPLLHTMYVDKRLAGIQAVQTLSRLNRIHPCFSQRP